MLTSEFAEESTDRIPTTASVAGTLATLDKFLSSPASFDSLVSFVNTYFIEPPTTADELYCEIDQIIASIDELVISQLNTILHHPKFQKIEASWRGLWYLVVQAEGVRNLKIKLLNANWLEVTKDIERALDFDQSQLYQKIYSEEYGTPGGEPYGVIIGDYDIHHKPNAQHPDDISTLDGLADIGSAAFTPFILGASPQLLGSNDFTELGQGSRLGDVFSQAEYIRWRSLREKPEARFVGLTLPRILMRAPYLKTTGSYKGLRFRELPADGNQEAYLWGNAAYAFGGILIREFAAVGWFGHIRGVPRDLLGGGLVTNLPMDSFDTDKIGIAFKPATDVLITDALEREISELGMVPLCHCYNTPFAAFYSNQSVQSVHRAPNSTTAINYKLSTMLQHVLCASRVAHYIKVMIRDKVGSFLSAEECQVYLGTWLRRYTTGRHDLEWEQQARYPLREANVTVREHPEKPGQYLCVIHLVPHYQIDQMVSELELVTELVQSN
ncbi:type VI secretion system contractile sheath large subunit [Teredinibacter turnerae]|uniref:type VI secretion system contractile sheath large subunit n=1 Tax=Teredinibacter turnerae TaxID=2426 RepID=UPI0004210BA7|nr:type VI secretion system contractile sheath large subunit [Teredinibacter turnerae]